MHPSDLRCGDSADSAREPSSSPDLPQVTIIIGMLNEEKNVKATLDSIARQTYPLDKMEVLAIDGGSTDRTVEIARQYGNLPNLRLIHNPRRTLAAAMNIGIQEAKGKYVLKVDAHSKIAEDYVEECVRCAEETGAELVGGAINPVAASSTGQAVALAMSLPLGTGGAKFRQSGFVGYVDTVYLGCYRKDVFDRIGLFDETLLRTEDDELNFRLRSSGGSVYMSSRIRSTYVPRDSLRALFSQYFQYGMWRLPAAAKHRGRFFSLRHAVPAGFVASLALFGVGGLLWPALHTALLGEILLYTAIVGGAALRACCAAGKHHLLFRVAAAVVSMHFGYGLGFFRGIPLALQKLQTTHGPQTPDQSPD